jgi:DNA polymerase-1
VPLILEYKAAKSQAQQAASLIECIAPDGRIHGRFEPTGTATGRFSSKEPNLQNIGRGALRACFVAPAGSKLVVADYSQIELRAAAAIAGETKMIEAYRRGEDLHRGTAAAVLGHNYPGSEWYADSYALLKGGERPGRENQGFLGRTIGKLF